MNAIVFDIRVNSLYSIRIPYTWQSALTFPIMPSSAIIGMLANALQRYKNDKHPIEYLKLIEKNIIWTGSRLLSPCIIKSYITSVVVKWEDIFPWKFTNALGRQFAYTKNLQICAIFKDSNLIGDITVAVKTTPITCGDSESPISVIDKILIKNVTEDTSIKNIKTEYPIPFTDKTRVIAGNGKIYMMHERCERKNGKLPLKTYLVPIKEENGIIYPSFIELEITSESLFKINDIGYVIK